MLTEAERENMRHALGLSRKPKPYRNYFVTDPHSDDGRCWERLCMRGLAEARPYRFASGTKCYRVTEAGRRALQAEEDRRGGC